LILFVSSTIGNALFPLCQPSLDLAASPQLACPSRLGDSAYYRQSSWQNQAHPGATCLN